MGVNVSDFNQDGQLDFGRHQPVQRVQLRGVGGRSGRRYSWGAVMEHSSRDRSLLTAAPFPFRRPAADLKWDGKTDLVVAHRGGGLALSGFCQCASRKRRRNISKCAEHIHRSARLGLGDSGRLEWNGKPDLVVNVNVPQSSFDFESAAAVFLGKGNGTFGAPTSYSTGGGGWHPLQLPLILMATAKLTWPWPTSV